MHEVVKTNLVPVFTVVAAFYFSFIYTRSPTKCIRKKAVICSSGA
jgi:hypothetical protein